MSPDQLVFSTAPSLSTWTKITVDFKALELRIIRSIRHTVLKAAKSLQFRESPSAFGLPSWATRGEVHVWHRCQCNARYGLCCIFITWLLHDIFIFKVEKRQKVTWKYCMHDRCKYVYIIFIHNFKIAKMYSWRNMHKIRMLQRCLGRDTNKCSSFDVEMELNQLLMNPASRGLMRARVREQNYGRKCL